jgi:phosphoribosyl 1,2-cyclic phosphodiesterase
MPLDGLLKVRFASLGSGSQGNALIVEAGSTRVLLDCGFGLADTTRRLARLGLQPEQLCAIVITHEHDDHIGGAGAIRTQA